jgi:hypothetical protein
VDDAIAVRADPPLPNPTRRLVAAVRGEVARTRPPAPVPVNELERLALDPALLTTRYRRNRGRLAAAALTKAVAHAAPVHEGCGPETVCASNFCAFRIAIPIVARVSSVLTTARRDSYRASSSLPSMAVA